MATTLDLESRYDLTEAQIAQFREQGFIKLKDVLSPEVIEHFGKAITDTVLREAAGIEPLEQRSTYGKAFLQIMNIWQRNEVVKAFAMSERLGRIAAELMGSDGVRMYHDQALYKEASGGHTPWHADQYYWPIETPNTCTVWAPLQATPLEMGALEFAAKSQDFEFGRNMAISDESEAELQAALEKQGFERVVEPFDLGEVSYHYGWTFHRAGPNRTDQARKVMTVIYIDSNARLMEPRNKNQQNDWETWCAGAKVGEIIDTPTNPMIWGTTEA